MCFCLNILEWSTQIGEWSIKNRTWPTEAAPNYGSKCYSSLDWPTVYMVCVSWGWMSGGQCWIASSPWEHVVRSVDRLGSPPLFSTPPLRSHNGLIHPATAILCRHISLLISMGLSKLSLFLFLSLPLPIFLIPSLSRPLSFSSHKYVCPSLLAPVESI